MAAEQTPAPPDLGDVLRDAAWPAVETTLKLAAMLWWLWLLVGVALVGRAVVHVVRERRLVRSGIYAVDRMEGHDFERFLETLFTRIGYRVELTPHRGDYGADLVIEKGGCRTAVQAKRYSKPVGLRAVQEVLGARGTYQCDLAMVVANRSYTAQARRLAADNDVELWDRDQLVATLLAGEDAAILSAPTPSNFRSPA